MLSVANRENRILMGCPRKRKAGVLGYGLEYAIDTFMML